MTFNLKKIRIGDAVEVTDYVANGSFASLKANVQYLDNSSPNKHAVLVRTLDFNRNWNGEYVWVDKAGFDFLKKSVLRKDDLVLCNVGSVGIVFEIPDLGFPMTLGPNSVLCRTKDVNLVRQKFLYYYFLSSSGQSLLQELSGGSTVQPKFNKTLLRNSEIEVPDLAHQDLVIKLLGSLDSKISLNETLSKTLADIAQTLFKSWFIDFDPVKAKMAGEKPVGMDAATASLFPDSMEESELGLIPTGWGVKVISDFGKVVTGKTPSTKVPEYWGENIPFVTIPDLHGQLLVTSTARALSQEGANSQRSQNIPAGSTMVTCIATPGLVGYATKNCQTNQQINSVIPNFEQSSIWLFWHLRGLIPTLIRNSGIGTVFANLNKSDFSNIKSITPDMPLRDAFSQIIEPIMELLTTTNYESQYLRDIRDTLLPRLISGDLQIPEEMLAS